MTRHLAILGAGGHGRVVADSAVACGWAVVFFDDTHLGCVDQWAVDGTSAELERCVGRFDGVIVAIGDNRARLGWFNRLAAAEGKLVTIADPSSRVSRMASIGSGSFLAAGSIVNIGSEIGRACIVNTGATIDHDCKIGDGVHLSPGVHLSGSVTIGVGSWLGTGCAVRNNIYIGSYVVGGVGSVIVKNIADKQTVVGVPAEPLEKA